MLQRAYADFAKAKLGPRNDPSNVLELLGHCGVLVAAGEAKGGQLIRSSDIEERVMDDASEILRALLGTGICLADVLYPGQDFGDILLSERPILWPLSARTWNNPIRFMASTLNLACFSAWAMEPERKGWHPNPGWPEFHRMQNVVRYVWSKRMPRPSDLGRKRQLVQPSWRPHLWWNYKELWTGHFSEHI